MSNQGPLPSFPTGAAGDEYVAGPYASWGRRIVPYLLDLLLVGAITVAIGAILGLASPFDSTIVRHLGNSHATTEFTRRFLHWSLLNYAVAFVYATAFLGSKLRATPFMALFKIRLARATDFGPAGYGVAALRTGVFTAAQLLGAFVPFIGLAILVDLLWPLWDDRNQTVHDKIARTVVVDGRVR